MRDNGPAPTRYTAESYPEGVVVDHRPSRRWPYPGGKNGSGVYQRIINLMPPHRVYIEPFLGGGAVLRLKRPAAVNIGLDLDSAVIDAAAGALVGSDDGRPTLMRAWRIGLTAESFIPTVSAASSDSDDGALRLRVGNGIDFLRAYRFRGDELVYCDPPYLESTCSSRPRYRFRMSTKDHRRLLRCIRNIPARVMISGYWSELYAETLVGWNTVSFQAMTRGGLATEWLWFNFPEPVALHDYRFVGENFRDRQRIKRKKASWTGKLRKMPMLERRALLEVIEREFV